MRHMLMPLVLSSQWRLLVWVIPIFAHMILLHRTRRKWLLSVEPTHYLGEKVVNEEEGGDREGREADCGVRELP